MRKIDENLLWRGGIDEAENWPSMDSVSEKVLCLVAENFGFCVTASEVMALSVNGNPFRR